MRETATWHIFCHLLRFSFLERRVLLLYILRVGIANSVGIHTRHAMPSAAARFARTAIILALADRVPRDAIASVILLAGLGAITGQWISQVITKRLGRGARHPQVAKRLSQRRVDQLVAGVSTNYGKHFGYRQVHDLINGQLGSKQLVTQRQVKSALRRINPAQHRARQQQVYRRINRFGYDHVRHEAAWWMSDMDQKLQDYGAPRRSPLTSQTSQPRNLATLQPRNLSTTLAARLSRLGLSRLGLSRLSRVSTARVSTARGSAAGGSPLASQPLPRVSAARLLAARPLGRSPSRARSLRLRHRRRALQVHLPPDRAAVQGRNLHVAGERHRRVQHACTERAFRSQPPLAAREPLTVCACESRRRRAACVQAAHCSRGPSEQVDL